MTLWASEIIVNKPFSRALSMLRKQPFFKRRESRWSVKRSDDPKIKAGQKCPDQHGRQGWDHP